MNLLCVVFCSILVCAGSAGSQPLEPIEAFPNLSFTKPVDLQNAGDGSDRLFIVEQEGIIRVFENSPSTSLSRLFLDVTDSVSTIGSEMGLLGLAFHPDYETNGLFFIYYTADEPLRSVLSQFTVSADPDSALRSSEVVLLEVPQKYTNHNGGQIAFGNDGFLYVAVGDGGSGGDPDTNAQNLSRLLGKILRIDVDSPENGLPYGIPADNPFVQNGLGYREEIFAYGLRNPWRFSFDPADGKLWCGDVGQSLLEEVNIIQKGGNYGWNTMEGTACYPTSAECSSAGFILPLWEYPRSFGRSITGGHVYRGSSVPSLSGRYVFGDFVSGILAALTYDGFSPPSVEVLDTLPEYSLTSFGVDESGELYLCLFSGSILRFPSTPVTSVQTESRPPSTMLDQNYPNPFNASTRLGFTIPIHGEATLTVFDALGKRVLIPFQGPVSPGFHDLVLDAGNLPSGVYFLELQVTGGSLWHRVVKRMLLLK
ncbi:MAG: PQQ-dependent sugar dehydrogenase [Bacteroidota bacterium]